MCPLKPATSLARSVVFAIWLSVLFSGCFEPEGEYFVPIDSPAFEGIEINLADAGSEIYLYKPARVSYRINEGNFQLIAIEGSLDGQSLHDPRDPAVIFIDPARFGHGTHALKIAATFLSSSGTLASIAGRETKTITRDFSVRIDLESPPAISIAKIEARDGSLFVSWNKPQKLNFINYRVHRYFRQNDAWVEHYFPDPWLLTTDKTGFNDSLYAGGDVQYRIDIKGYNYSTPGTSAETSFPTFHPVMEHPGVNTVKVSWQPSPFYKNMSSLRLRASNEPDHTLPSDEAASFTREISFGGALVHALTPLMKYGNGYLPTVIRSHVGNLVTVEGVSVSYPYEYPLYMPYGNREIMVTNRTNLYLVNSAAHTVEKKVDLIPYYQNSTNPMASDRAGFEMTPDGNSFYLFTGTEAIRFDKDLKFIKKVDLPELNPNSFFNVAYNIRFSNNNIAAFLFYPLKIRLIDFENNTVITTSSLPDSGTPFNISADGKYFFYNKKLYDISGGSLNEVADLSNARDLRDVRFNNASSQLFMSYEDGHFAIVDLVSRSVVSTYDFPGSAREIQQDPITGLCGVNVVHPVTGKKELFVFDPATFSISKKVWIGTECFLYNNTLYANTGFILPL
jgi:hypothetical protein